MSTSFSKILEKREIKVVKNLSIPEDAWNKSPFIIKKREDAKRFMREHPFPVELWRAR